MKLFSSIVALTVTGIASAQSSVTFQDSSQTILRTDNGTYGPALEEYHYYYDQWPIGLAISSTGRFFVSYTRGTYAYTLGETVNKTAGEHAGMSGRHRSNDNSQSVPTHPPRPTCL